MNSAESDRATIAVPLSDGLVIGIRPIVASDPKLVTETFADMSDQSRYQRFFSPVDELTSHDMKYLTEMDGSNRFAWAAQVGERPVGVARYVRFADELHAADVAIGIADEFQHRGIGNALVRCLGPVAGLVAIEEFSFDVLPSNAPMLNLLRSINVTISHDGQIDRGRIRVDELPPPPVESESLLVMVREAIGPIVRRIS